MLTRILAFALFSIISVSANAQTDSLLGKIYFDFDQSVIMPVSAATLQKLAADYKSISGITLTGRTDIRGNFVYNDSLAARRVAAVEKYLLELGFAPAQITKRIALGKRSPIGEQEINAAARNQLNRVVEITGIVQTTVAIPAPPVKALQEQIKEGKANIILNNLNFEGGRHLLLPSSLPTLNEVLEVMKNNPTLQVEIRGHICCAEITEDGLDIDTGEKVLSRNRAREIYLFLINNGISNSRLSYTGMGASKKIIADEITDKDRETNRRVEFVIIKR
jgi:outer membrane protein OmpA-like peptidoglycan-associated protein